MKLKKQLITHIFLVMSAFFGVNSYMNASSGPSLNDQSLIKASDEGDLIKVEKLLQEGADVNARTTEKKKTPLMLSANKGYTDVVKALIDAWADPNLQTANGNTALMLAAKKNHSDIVQELLNANANMTIRNKDGRTALDEALDNRARLSANLISYKLLGLEKGNATKNEIEKAFKKLALQFHPDRAKSPDQAKEYNEIFKDLGKAKELLLKQIESPSSSPEQPSSSAPKYTSELFDAVEKADLKTINALIQKKVDLDKQDNDGITVLMVAVARGYSNIVEVLIKANARLNLTNRDGRTALMVAVKSGNLTIVEMLIQAKADLNVKNNFGRTALMTAASLGEVAIVETLLRNGADFNAVDKWGKTALQYAELNNHSKIADLIKHVINYGSMPTYEKPSSSYEKPSSSSSKSADLSSELFDAVANADLETINDLIQKKVDLNKKNKDGNTALMIAIEKGYTKIVRILIRAKANINEKNNNNGRTALMTAAILGNIDIVELILQYKVDIGLQDNDGKTALQYAQEKKHHTIEELLNGDILLPNLAILQERYKKQSALLIAAAKQGDLTRVKQLIAQDVDPNGRDREGLTALIWAVIYHHQDIVRVLIKNGANVNVESNGGLTALWEARNKPEIEKLLKEAGAKK